MREVVYHSRNWCLQSILHMESYALSLGDRLPLISDIYYMSEQIPFSQVLVRSPNSWLMLLLSSPIHSSEKCSFIEKYLHIQYTWVAISAQARRSAFLVCLRVSWSTDRTMNQTWSMEVLLKINLDVGRPRESPMCEWLWVLKCPKAIITRTGKGGTWNRANMLEYTDKDGEKHMFLKSLSIPAM